MRVLLVLLVCIPFFSISQVNYSHPSKRSFLQYELDSTGKVAFQLNYFVNTASDDYFFAFPGQTVDLQGPLTVSLAYTPSLNEVFYTDSCTELLVKMVFRSTFIDLSPYLNSASALVFNFDASSFQAGNPDNHQSTQVPMASRLRLIPEFNSVSSQWELKPHGNLSTEHYPLVDFPRAGQKQILPLGAKALGEGLDSVVVKSIPLIGNPSFAAGYSQSTPFPDLTENSTNGSNHFSAKNKSWRFEINDTTGLNLPFVSYYGLRYEYFADGFLFATVDHHGWASIEDPAPSGNALVSLTKNGSSQIINGNYFKDTLLVYVDDSLTLDFNAISGSDTTRWEIVQNPLDSTMVGAIPPQWQGGVFSSLNSSGQFSGSGLNQARFEWQPKDDNFWQGPQNFTLLFKLSEGSCPNRSERWIELLIRLRVKPQILASGQGLFSPDTLIYCGNDVRPSVYFPTFNTDTSGYYWSPTHWFNGSDSLLSFLTMANPGQSGWLYLREINSGVKVDSAYINFIPNRRDYVYYDRFPNYLQTRDSLNQAYRFPTVHNFVYGGGYNVDSFPIIGAGAYRIFSQPGGNCLWATDTIRVDNILYGSSLPIDTIYYPSMRYDTEDEVFRWSFHDFNNRDYLQHLNFVGVEIPQSQYLYYRFYEDGQLLRSDSVWLDSSANYQPIKMPIAQSLNSSSTYSLEWETQFSARMNFARNITYPLQTGHSKPMHMYAMERLNSIGNWSPLNDVPYIGMVFGVEPIGLLENEQNRTWRIYPNPASHQLRLQGQAEGGSYAIFDLQGRCLLQGEMAAQEAEIDIRSLQAGSYIFQLGNQSTKLVIEP